MTGHLDSFTLGFTQTPAPATTGPSTMPRRSKKWGRLGLVAIVLAGGAAYYGRTWLNPAPSVQAAAPAMPALPVTVSAPLQRTMAGSTIFTGQFSAVDTVEIRPQVTGYLTEIHFTDGQIVHQGDLLFVIDPRPYQAQLQQATAQYQIASAGLDLANKQLARTQNLTQSDFASRETLDQRLQQQQAAVAALEQAKAAIRTAQLNLEFTRITAPLTGKISARQASIGSLIMGGSGAPTSSLLTTIVSTDPIHLDFEMSESDYLAYQRYLKAQGANGNIDHTVDADLADEQGWQHHGTLDFVDNQMDRSSGTIHARATLPNPDMFIAAGQFARLRLPTSAPRPVLLVPDAAVTTDQSRKIVMTVAKDGTVVPKQVEIGTLTDGLRVITAGLDANDQVIINGLMRARPGSKVAPLPGKIAPAAQG